MKIKKTKKKRKSKKKRLMITALSITLLLIATIPVFAWFINQRKLSTMAKIKSPTTLNIGAGNKEAAANIDLGGIDVEGDAQSKDFVFCVYSGTTTGKYKIQIAHTTNIDFTYNVYKATAYDEDGENVVTYISEDDNMTYYYQKGDQIAGDYINQDPNTKIANNDKHEVTYDSYNNVQKNAEPLYWQSKDPISPTGTEGTGFVDYYVLEVSWEKGAVKNDKETDMVYLTAGMVS